MLVYELKQVTKVYNQKTVLDLPILKMDISKIYALLGSNGAGKTTLLNILAFLKRPSCGEVYYLNKPVRFIEAELKILRQNVILVEQHPILFTTTVYKNLEFGLKIRRIEKAKRAVLIDAALDLVGMRAFAKARAQHLSGGETQRVALARGLVLTPQVLLCDEPTSSVDDQNQNIILDILTHINTEQQSTVIFTTHDHTQADMIAHHTLVLEHGRLMSK